MIFFTVALIVHGVRIWLKFESSIPNFKNITSVYTVRFSLFWYHLIFNSNIFITHMIMHLHWIFRVQYIATQCNAMIIYMMLTIVSHIVLSLVNGGYGSHSYGKLWFSSYLQSRVVFLYATFFEHWINNVILEMTQCGSFMYYDTENILLSDASSYNNFNRGLITFVVSRLPFLWKN